MKRMVLLPLVAITFACYLPPHDDRPAEVKAAADKQPAAKSDTSGDVRARADYLSKVTVRKVVASKATNTPEPVGFVDGEVKNTGDRSLDEVQVTIYFLDRNGKVIHEDTYHPLLVGGFLDQLPLKANYAIKFGGGFRNIPDEWSGNVSVKVTDVKFTVDS